VSGVLVDPLVPLRAAVDASVVTDPADLGDIALSEEIVSVRAEIDRLEAQFARLVCAGHQRGIGSGRRFPIDRGLAPAPHRNAGGRRPGRHRGRRGL
jgi:hypothetical protein